ncbi:MarR family winged helix-turn-helix transcriptional regulator [Sphingopyxis sp. BSN-002]|uniref:MarR family winged helix-turn-helix transcriptional regulator n=1 Tax=Sphingopyxis sp. BSN-002 TaxID=2911495 RepID=UPI001EDB4268|nr:MarR family winged helix-turn-helix transcriptional regulator [Sphingopyxis sp. BSN-002]UKK83995.1 MarR family winged helix-turn-helix transcriptional regulator [Sphingopyxis sp. BSN-002]
MENAEPPEGERIAQLCRAIYEDMRESVYAGAARRGFDDLRPAHSGVLRHIDAAGSRVVDLAERAGMTKQSMAYLTEGLAALDYVEIGADPGDRRAKRVLLTRRGRDAVATLTKLSLEAEAAIADKIGKGRIEALRKDLRDIKAALRRAAPGQ